MANDVVGMTEMFRACVAVLEDRLVPLHYAELTRLGLGRLGVSEQQVNWKRQIEDIREKLVQAGQYDTAYTGEPLCLVLLQSWVRKEEALHLFNSAKPIVIDPNFPASEEACFEALMREPHMIKKTATSRERRNRGLARGMLIEQHVKDYFRLSWPDYYVPPDNDGKWDRPCDHDFKLRIGVRLRKVDVAGEHLDGHYGLSTRKRAVNIHVMARLSGNTLVLDGFSPGDEFSAREDVDWWHLNPIQPLVVYLNCQKVGIDYAALRQRKFPPGRKGS